MNAALRGSDLQVAKAPSGWKENWYNGVMYIVAIGWIYVVLMMALVETSVVAGIMTFFWYGVLPLTLLLWLIGIPRRRRSAVAADQAPGQPDGADSQAD